MNSRVGVNNNLLVLLSLILVFLCDIAFGVQRYKLSAEKVIEGRISASELNRIRVEGDRIKEAIGLSDHYMVQGESNTGQIFIKNIEVSNKAPAIFSIITEKNRTIDLRLVPDSKSAESIIIGTIDGYGEEGSSSTINSYDNIKHKEQEYLVELIKNAALEVNTGKVLAEKKFNGLLAKLIKVKKVNSNSLEVWEITNTSSFMKELHEKGFNVKEGSIKAIGIENRHVPAGATTLMYVVSND